MVEDLGTLKTGKYTIEISTGGTIIYTIDDFEQKEWLATTTDPEKAMEIVEGLILVEHKRFYHPEAAPQLFVDENKEKPSPPFLKKRD